MSRNTHSSKLRVSGSDRQHERNRRRKRFAQKAKHGVANANRLGQKVAHAGNA